jgi:hypothetical protein
VAKLLDKHTDQDDLNYQRFLTEIQKQDLWKGISITDYLPEFAEHLPLDQSFALCYNKHMITWRML